MDPHLESWTFIVDLGEGRFIINHKSYFSTFSTLKSDVNLPTWIIIRITTNWIQVHATRTLDFTKTNGKAVGV